MVQVVQGKEGFGSLLGRQVGSGLSESLNSLAQSKLEDLLQGQRSARAVPGLEALGIPADQARDIARLPDSIQALVVKNYLQGAENAGLDRSLALLSGEEVQSQNELPRELLQQAQPEQQKLSPFATPQDIFSSLVNPKSRTNLRSNAKQESKIPATSQPQAAPNTNNLKDILTRPRLSPEHRLKIAGLQQQRQQHLEKLSAKQQEEVNKETKPSYDTIIKEAKAAKDNKKRLDQMERLIVRGGLNSPGFSTFVDAIKSIFKVDVSALETADTQEFRKLSNDFVKNAKDYFGSRLTDADLKVFLATIPNVSQSGEAKQRVVQNLRLFADIAEAKQKAAHDVIRENGGKRPRNFEEEVDLRIKPTEDALVKKFYENKAAIESILKS